MQGRAPPKASRSPQGCVPPRLPQPRRGNPRPERSRARWGLARPCADAPGGSQTEARQESRAAGASPQSCCCSAQRVGLWEPVRQVWELLPRPPGRLIQASNCSTQAVASGQRGQEPPGTNDCCQRNAGLMAQGRGRRRRPSVSRAQSQEGHGGVFTTAMARCRDRGKARLLCVFGSCPLNCSGQKQEKLDSNHSPQPLHLASGIRTRQYDAVHFKTPSYVYA